MPCSRQRIKVLHAIIEACKDTSDGKKKPNRHFIRRTRLWRSCLSNAFGKVGGDLASMSIFLSHLNFLSFMPWYS